MIRGEASSSVQSRVLVGVGAALVAVAFADTSVVALALPRIYGEFGLSIVAASWVLMGYAASVCTAAAALLPFRRWLDERSLTLTGLLALAGSCIVAAATHDWWVLVISRCVQGAGAAALLIGTWSVIAAHSGAVDRGRIWTRAASLGLAAGPAVGGTLTQVFDWRSIFLVQIPIAAAGMLLLGRLGSPRDHAVPVTPVATHSLGSTVGTALLSGGLVGALFLTVLLVVEVWRMTPLAGAGVVSALPAGMGLTLVLASRLSPSALVVGGVVTLPGGLLALAFLPSASPAWAITSLVLCGSGWAMLELAFDGDSPQGPGSGRNGSVNQPVAALRAGATATISRHAGLVLGLAVLAPILAGQLQHATQDATLSGTAAVLDARMPLTDKISLASTLRDGLSNSARGSIPDVVSMVERSEAPTPAAHRLGADIADLLRDALTRAFRTSFLTAAGIAAGTAAPGVVVAFRRRRRPRPLRGGPVPAGATAFDVPAGGRDPQAAPSPRRPPVNSAWMLAGLSLAIGILLIAERAAGAAVFGVAAQADPCHASADPYPGSGLDAAEQKIVLSTLNGAACSLHTSREALVLSLDGKARFGTRGLAPEQVQPALRAGLARAVDDAQRRGDLPVLAAAALRFVVGRVPLQWLSDRLGLPSLAH